MLNVLDLFSGTGELGRAFGKALGWHGIESRTIAYCERERFPQGILLSRQFRGEIDRAPISTDVCQLTGAGLLEATGLDRIHAFIGGFPCQDLSVAGKGAGLAGKRSGLFYEIIRLAGELQPDIIGLENVSAITIRGGGGQLLERLPSWGMTADGLLYPLQTLVPAIAESGGGAWPTVRGEDSESCGPHGEKLDSLGSLSKEWRTPDTGAGGSSGRLARGETHRPSGAAITMRLDDQVKAQERAWPTISGTQGGQTSRGGKRKGEKLMGGIIRNWHTPRAQENGEAAETFVKRNGDRSEDCFSGLTAQATQESARPTPRASDSKGAGQPGDKAHQHQTERGQLGAIATGWATPTKSAAHGADFNKVTREGSGADDLMTQVSRLDPPDPEIPSGRLSATDAPKLNPLFVEWLLGWPFGTTELEPAVTAWIVAQRKRRLKS